MESLGTFAPSAAGKKNLCAAVHGSFCGGAGKRESEDIMKDNSKNREARNGYVQINCNDSRKAGVKKNSEKEYKIYAG